MSKKELYEQKMQAQLDVWQADVEKLNARASLASANAQLELNREINALKGNLELGKSRLAEIEDASEEAWESIKVGVDSAWDSLKVAFSDAKAKFN